MKSFANALNELAKENYSYHSYMSRKKNKKIFLRTKRKESNGKLVNS